MRRLTVFSILTAIVLTAVLGAVPLGAQEEDLAQVRLVHAAADASAVQVAIDDVVVAPGLAFTYATDYFALPAGKHTISTGDAAAALDLEAGQSMTILYRSADGVPELKAVRDDRTPLTLGNGRLVVIHAAGNVDAVDVLAADGSTLIGGVGAGKASPPVELPAGVYDLTFADAEGNALSGSTTVEVNTGTLYTIVLFDTGSLPLTVSTNAADPANAAMLRMVHASPDAPKVDVYLNDVKSVAGLGFGDATEQIALPADDYTIAFYEADADPAAAQPLMAAALALSGGESRVLMTLGEMADLQLVAFIEDATAPTPGTSRLTVIHAVPDAPAVNLLLPDGAVMAENLAFGSQSPSLELAPDTYEIAVTNAATGAELLTLGRTQLDAGRVYTSVVVPPSQGTQMVMPIVFSLPVAPPSASEGATAAGVPEAPAPDETETGETVAEAAEEAMSETTEETAEVAAAIEPSDQPTVEPTAEPAAAPSDTSTTASKYKGRVNTSSGAYLNVRFNPNLDEAPMPIPGLPPNTEVEVLGRDASTEWLVIRWQPPQGNLVQGWVVSYLIEVTVDGKPLEFLEDMPVISGPPATTGQATGTVATTTTTTTTTDDTDTEAATDAAEGEGESEVRAGQATFSISDFYYMDNNVAHMNVTITNVSMQPAIASGTFSEKPQEDGNPHWVTLLKADFVPNANIPFPLIWEPLYGRAPLWEFVVNTSDGYTFTAYAGCEYFNEIVTEGFEPTKEGGFNWTQVLEGGWFRCGREYDPSPKPMDDLKPGDSATVPLLVYLKEPSDATAPPRTITQLEVRVYAPNGEFLGSLGTWTP